jgi:hypothetical protein
MLQVHGVGQHGELASRRDREELGALQPERLRLAALRAHDEELRDGAGAGGAVDDRLVIGREERSEH